MSRVLGLLSTFAITGMILFGLAADFRISFDRRYWASGAATLAIVLILATRRIYLPVKTLESLIPESKQDALVVLLVLLQTFYCLWEVFYWSSYLPLMLPSIGIFVIVIVALPSYLNGRRWAWALIFLFSLYILHQAIFLENRWDWDFDLYVPKWIALLDLTASALCLRFMASTAKTHSIDRLEFARVLGAVAIAVGAIYVKGGLSPLGLWPWALIRGYADWDFIVGESALQPWMILALLWTCYAGLCLASWIYTQTASLKKE